MIRQSSNDLCRFGYMLKHVTGNDDVKTRLWEQVIDRVTELSNPINWGIVIVD
jgi:hypothetical protein